MGYFSQLHAEITCMAEDGASAVDIAQKLKLSVDDVEEVLREAEPEQPQSEIERMFNRLTII